MVVMILEHMTPALRGELTRWLIEPRTGVYVGHINAIVRDRLWEKCCKSAGEKGGVVQLWTTNTEQHFAMRLHGDTQRRVVELEGLQLIRIPNLTEGVQKKVRQRVRSQSSPPDMGD